jgi:hypothetical protein
MSTQTTAGSTRRKGGARAADLVRWGPVVAGVVIGLGAFALFDALWFAIAAGNGNGAVTGNLDWFVGGTGIGAMLVAGFAAGLLSGARGVGAGIGNGVTTWGLLVVLTAVGGLPGLLGISGALNWDVTARQVLWTTFWALLIGLGCAALGGMLGGLVRRPVVVADARPRDEAAEPTTDERPRSFRVEGNEVEDRPTAPLDEHAETPAVAGRRG